MNNIFGQKSFNYKFLKTEHNGPLVIMVPERKRVKMDAGIFWLCLAAPEWLQFLSGFFAGMSQEYDPTFLERLI